ncbi:hypothetical protein ACLKA7_016345 [Drosophila subpalustris]
MAQNNWNTQMHCEAVINLNDKDILCVYMHICKAKEQLSSSSVFDLRFEAGGNGMTRKAQKAAQAMPLHVIVWHKIGKMKLKMVVEMEWK